MKNITIFASGKGSNANNIINYFKKHPKIYIKLIITNNPKSGVINLAHESKIECLIFHKDDFLSGKVILQSLLNREISHIILAGFLLKIPTNIITSFQNSILNIHPSILPEFGGKDMYGINVHNAVLKAKKKYSGITIHYVTEEYDEGKIVFQAKCDVFENDTVKLLAQRIQKLEYEFYPIIIQKIINNGN